MSDIPTSRCRVSRLPVVKYPDTKKNQRRTSKNNMKITKNETQNEPIMVIQLNCQFPVPLDQSDNILKLPVIQF